MEVAHCLFSILHSSLSPAPIYERGGGGVGVFQRVLLVVLETSVVPFHFFHVGFHGVLISVMNLFQMRVYIRVLNWSIRVFEFPIEINGNKKKIKITDHIVLFHILKLKTQVFHSYTLGRPNP